MSQHDETTRTPSTNAPGSTTPETPLAVPPTDADAGQPEPGAPTIGTGTSIALGCVAGTILLIGIGLLYILILAIF